MGAGSLRSDLKVKNTKAGKLPLFMAYLIWAIDSENSKVYPPVGNGIVVRIVMVFRQSFLDDSIFCWLSLLSISLVSNLVVDISQA